MGVPALLPQRRELGWPNRGAATTPGADVGGWPRLWGPRVDRRVDDGPRRSDHGEKQPDPRVGLLTQIPIPWPSNGRARFAEEGPPRLGPGKLGEEEIFAALSAQTRRRHRARHAGTHSADPRGAPAGSTTSTPASDVTVGALAPRCETAGPAPRVSDQPPGPADNTVADHQRQGARVHTDPGRSATPLAPGSRRITGGSWRAQPAACFALVCASR